MKKTVICAFFVSFAVFMIATSFEVAAATSQKITYPGVVIKDGRTSWYVNPGNGKRFALHDGAVADRVIHQLGVGIPKTELQKLQRGDKLLKKKYWGWFVFSLEKRSEAVYVCWRDGSVRKIKNGTGILAAVQTCRRSLSKTTLNRLPIGVTSASKPVLPPAPTTSAPTPAPAPSSSATVTTSPTIAGCAIFPADNPWNQDISKLPLHANSATYIASIGNRNLHPDFGWYGQYGIPYSVVSGAQKKVPITFTAYGDESDPGPYPIPDDAKVEGNGSGDSHVLVLEKDSCTLYELYMARKTANGWSGDSGAVWDLKSNKLRPDYWTSADAAGLPILPGLVRYDEVTAGEVKHAIRFTAPKTQRGFIYPATHFAGTNNDALPPMGLRVRLKASYDISNLTGQAKVIATAMKKYGMILADNGSGWFFTGAQDPRWVEDEIQQLKKIPGSAFEAVDTGPIRK